MGKLLLPPPGDLLIAEKEDDRLSPKTETLETKTEPGSAIQNIYEPLDSLCYAFVLDADIFVTCNGKREIITYFDDISGFAVAPDGSAVAFENSVVSLEGDFNSHQIRGPSRRLTPTCGTIIAYPPPLDYVKSSAQLQDILRDDPLDFEGSFERYGDFRCSSDRETVARWERPPYPKNAILTVHRIDKSEAILTLQLDSSFYDISPNGRYVAS